MNGDDETKALLREIRDLIAAQKQQYKDYLADAEKTYADAMRKSRQQAMAMRAFQWGALFVIVYSAVYFALQHAR